MRGENLGGMILKDVSRSFYLSLRILPAGFREPASVGYLLARLGDTIADTGEVDLNARRELLREFRALVLQGGPWRRFQARLDETFTPHQRHPGERALVARAGECLDWMRTLGAWKCEAVQEVVGLITEGQGWDLQRFEATGVVRLQDVEELDRYTYLVAGSVGEFWTTLGFGLDPDFAGLGPVGMRTLGRNFGMGLQLVNILRDVADDARIGRCYLPGEGSPVDAVPIWSARARHCLQDGLRYTAALRGKRLRLATGLPALLGLRTLDLVEDAAETPGSDHPRPKVSRPELRRLAWMALRAACLPGPAPWERLSKIADRSRQRQD